MTAMITVAVATRRWFVTNRLGRNRLTKDQLRELLRELYKQRFKDDPEADRCAKQAVTKPEVAHWLQEQGAIAAGTELSPQDKIMAINGNLVAKLGELGLVEHFGRAVLTKITAALLRTYKVVTEPDADELHESLRDSVLSYIRGVLKIGETEDAIVVEAEAGISRSLMLMRYEEINPDQAMSQLMFHFAWLACAMGMDMTALRGELSGIDQKLWELVSVYAGEEPSSQPA